MTTPTAINDIGDLLRILEERPEWSERLRAILLTRELRELPEQITQLTARVDRLAQAQEETNRAVRETNARVDRLAQAQEETNRAVRETNAKLDRFIAAQEATNRAQQETNARLDRFIESQEAINRAQQETNARLDRFIESQEAINRAIQETNARLDRFIESQEAINRAIQETNAAQQETNAQVALRLESLENQAAEMRLQLNRLLGSDLENQLNGNIASIVARNFNLRRVHILKSRFVPPNQRFYDRLYAAEDAGRITPEQSLQLLEADFILAARERETQNRVYLAVEVSRTVGERDITRAKERADALQAATGDSARALVVGSFVPGPEYERAAEHNVTLVQERQD